LSQSKREQLSATVKKYASAWAVGVVEQKIIDRVNIHNAGLLAMKGAVKKVLKQVSSQTAKPLALIDGKFQVPGINVPQEAIVDGDNKVLSIAAASILAKVHRDNLMLNAHKKYPVYNFAKHKGYGTLYHKEMIAKYGISPIHRISFCTNC